ncbi:MAG: hypothetical protein B7X60_01530 [Polynucleobacter sp. 39-45-136]|jgi:hypothetical protein|nr:MAG: hypothetical protein B7X60_01530 [Polynucleobacter sp. 39-45-136]
MGNIDFSQEKVSVVVATIGEPTLLDTIISLNSSTLIPAEILVCTPLKDLIKFDEALFHNVQIIECVHWGQVLQRIEGFKCAKYKYVLQIDSDINVHASCLQNLVLAMNQLPKKSCVSPFPEKIHRANRGSNFISKIFDKSLACKWSTNSVGQIKRTCRISSPYIKRSENLFQTEWVNGIVMHRKENLILDCYYPYKGKAYYEDVIHSIFLRRGGVSLWVCQNAGIMHLGDSLSEYSTLRECSEYFIKILSIRRYIFKIHGGSSLLIFLIWMFEFFYALGKTLFFSNYLRLIKKG